MQRGRLPLVSSHLCVATLLPFVKKGGGHRPIAVGEVLRRLTSKCISLSVHSLTPDILSPLQLGVAVPNGAEAIVHAVKPVRLNPNIPPTSKWILLIDFANAFNSVNREHMFTSIREVLLRSPSGWSVATRLLFFTWVTHISSAVQGSSKVIR